MNFKPNLYLYTLTIAGLLLLLASCSPAIRNNTIPETEAEPTSTKVSGYVFKPALVPATDENVKQLKRPDGFVIQKFAENMGNPRMLATTEEGYIYVSDREAGSITLLEDTNDDGIADRKENVAKIEHAHGLSVNKGRLYIVGIRKIYRADINEDGTLSSPVMLTDSLPDGGQHPNRTLAFGADNMMYISAGSTCNACDEGNPYNATILQANADAGNIRVFAEGLRNTIGFDWHPETGDLWGMDHGIDWLGDNEQKEELNKIVGNADYGWPYIYGAGHYNPADRPQDMAYKEYLKKVTLPTLTYQAHAAPMQLLFYTRQQFPKEYKNDAFVVFRGSWNRSDPVGYEVARLEFENGRPIGFKDFVSGFLLKDEGEQFGRLAGLAIHADGSLLLADDTNGVIYRISYNSKIKGQ